MRYAVAAGFEYTVEEVWLPCSEGILDWGEGFHALLLHDHVRMTAFAAAIREVVRPGATVLDLGTGTGILAQWALEAGAGRVYGIDCNEAVLAQAVRRIAAAGHGPRFHPVPGLSFDVELPDRVDVVISEMIGNLGDNEDFVRLLADARRRFLKPEGRIVPSRVETYLVPVAAAGAHARVARRDVRGAEQASALDTLLAGRGASGPFDLYYDAVLPASSHLAAPRLLRALDLGDDAPSTYRANLVWSVHRPALLTGFKGYFVADLSPTVALDISGDDVANRTASDSWKHCYLPVAEPVHVEREDRIALTLTRSYPGPDAGPFGQRYRWEGRVLRGRSTIAAFAQDTWRSAGAVRPAPAPRPPAPARRS